MERSRKPVPAGRRFPVMLIVLGLIAVGGVLLLLRAPLPPPKPIPVIAVVPTPTVTPKPTPDPPPTIPAQLRRQSGTLLLATRRIRKNSDDERYLMMSALDLSGGKRWSVGFVRDMLAAPDGKRVYVVQNVAGGEQIAAIDPQFGTVWATPISQTVRYEQGNGPSALVLAPDGSTLYVVSYNDAQRQWLQIVDTATGVVSTTTILLPEVEDCGGVRFFVAANNRIFLHCTINADGSIFELYQSINRIDFVPLREPTKSMVVAADGTTIYGILNGPQLVAFDLINYTYNADNNSFRRMYAPDEWLLTVEPGLVQRSGDGKRLVIGTFIDRPTKPRAATELRVYDTTTWQEITRISYPKPIRTNTLAINHDGTSIYAVTSADDAAFRPSTAVLRLRKAFPGDRTRLVVTTDGSIMAVDTVEMPPPSAAIADTIVEFDGTTGQIRAESTRLGEDITLIQWMPN